MATYRTNFTEYTVGVFPSDWTGYFTDGLSTTIATSGTTKVLRSSFSNGNSGVLSWNPPSTEVPNTNFEMLVCYKSGVNAVGFYPMGGIDTTAGSGIFYEAGLSTDGYITSVSNYALTVTGTTFTTSPGNYYWVRSRMNGTLMSLRIWADGTAEPGTWNVSSSTGTPQNANQGPMGWYISSYNATASSIDVRYYSVAVGGGTAPTPVTVTADAITLSSDSSATASGSVYSTTKKSAATITTIPDSVNGNTWSNTSNLFAEDGATASSGMPNGGSRTPALQLTGWGFNIPSTSKVTGVKVETKNYGSAYGDYQARLMLNGNQVGRDRSLSFANAGTPGSWYSRGGQYDTWGLNLTPNDVNSSSFGYNLMFYNTSGGGTVNVDAVQVTVYYDVAPFYQVVQQYEGNTYIQYGNQAFGSAEAIHEITNATGAAIPLQMLKYKWRAVYGTFGGGKDTPGTFYDRTGTPYTVKVYSTQADSLAQNANYIKQFTGTLLSNTFQDYSFDLASANFTLAAGSKIWVNIICTGTSGSGEPGFIEIYGGRTNPDTNAQVYVTGAYNGGGSWSSSSDDLDYILYGPETPVTVNLSGDSILDVSGTVTASSIVPLSSDSNLTVSGTVTQFGASALSADSIISINANVGLFATFAESSDSTLAVTGSKEFYGIASWSSDSLLVVDAMRTAVTGASWVGDSTAGVSSSGIDITHLVIQKSYIYKIYSKTGAYLGVWNDVVSEFGYSQEVNSAGSSITVTLARNSDSLVANYDSLADDSSVLLNTDSGETIAAETTTVNAIGPGTTVDLNLNVVVYEFTTDVQPVEGTVVFTGYISMYTSRYGTTENTDVSIFSYGADLDNWTLVDSTNQTRVPYLTKDPSVILKDTLDKFAAAGGLITYDSSSVESPTTVMGSPWNVTYTFNANTELEVIKQCLALSPTDWFFYADLATNKLHFHPRPSTVSHYFYLGKHVLGLNLEKSMEGIVNDVIFTGGEPVNISLDRFFDVAGTHLISHSGEQNAVWVKHPVSAAGTGLMISNANRLRQGNTGSAEMTYMTSNDMGTSDYEIEVDYWTPTSYTTNADIGLVGRVDPTNLTFYLARIISDSTIQLYKCVNGTFTQLQNGTLKTALAAGQTRNMKFKLEGAQLTVTVDGTAYIDIEDRSIVYGTRTGIRSGIGVANDTQGFHMDNFKTRLLDNSNAVRVFKRYTDSTSISTYRRGLKRMSDNRVTLVASADTIVLSEINRNNKPRYRSTITISNSTYDTKSIKLGQIIGFKNFGNFIDDPVSPVLMQVVRIDYRPDSVVLQLDTLLPSVPKRLEDIKRNLYQAEVTDNPDAPALASL